MRITRFLHAAVVVRDLERSERFWGDLLGLPKVDRPLKFAGTWYQVGDFQIHLILALAPASDCIEPEKLGRNRHLAFAIADLHALQQRLLQHGYPFQMSASGRAALFIEDPDGNIVELSER